MLDIIEWLAGDECHGLDDAGLAEGLGQRLRTAGLPVDHLALYLRRLHPEIRGRTIGWAPGESAQIRDRQHGIELSAAFADSPVRRVMETQEPLVLQVEDGTDASWMHTDILEGRRLAEFLIVPLRNSDGHASAASFATARGGGYSDTERTALLRIVPALRTVCELRTLRMIERTLLDTYVGTLTGRRVLEGHIRRGEVETLEAALMLCDLRGFTELSNRLPSERVLQLLDAYFGCVVPAIGNAGGEVIKFMGDAVLAFFHRPQAAAACAAGLEGAVSALESLRRLALPDAKLRAGVALHYGTVSYGNIGAGHRLDFTLIGPDVNLVSRLQAVCSMTGYPLLMSERFAGFLDPARVTTLGQHELKGFKQPAQLYTLVKQSVGPRRDIKPKPAALPGPNPL
jgi:adenylate cyclase